MKEKDNVRDLKNPVFKATHALKFAIVLLVLACTVQAWASPGSLRQQPPKHKITGQVTSASDNSSIPGVSIKVKGTSTGTITDIDGKFSIDVTDNDVLQVSVVGFKSEEMAVAGKSTVTIQLQQSDVSLEEVVVVGYGVQKKKLVTGATVQVKGEDLVNNRVNRLESALQGLTPGMSIVQQSGQPGSDYNITIRGLSSVNGNGPLVLVDGVPGNLNTLNPSDIETLDVLKDAASAAIYGSRASNGVILVTTKKGKAGQAQVSYDFSYGMSNAPRKMPLLNAKEYAIIMNEAAANSGSSPFFSQNYIKGLGAGTDWQEEIYNKNAPSQNHYLGITGGTDKSRYSLSLSYASEEGIFDFENKSKYERFGFRVNTESNVKKFLKIGENLTYTHRISHGLGVGNIYGNFMHDVLNASPLIKAYDPAVYDGFGRSDFNDAQINPIASMHYNFNDLKKYDDLIGDVYAEVEILKGLKFRTDFGGTLSFTYTTNPTDSFKLTPYTYQSIPIYKQDMSRTFNSNFDNVLSYEKIFGKHNVLAMIGMNAQDNWFFKQGTQVNGSLINSAPVLSNVVPDTTIATGDYGKGDSRYSYFGRLSYSYDETYMATVSLRRDGSSRFGKNNRFGNFFAASAGWVISKEKFFEPLATYVDFLKLRGSWGQNGKEPASSYAYMATVGNTNRYYAFGAGKQTGISPIIYANPDLKWEATEQIDFGFDARFLKDFRFTFDWYKKTSKDWIMQKTIAGYSGIAGISTTSNPFVNGGNVTNKGVELELQYIKSFGDLTLDLKANMAYNKNKVTSVPGNIIHGASNVLYNGASEIYRIQEGLPMGYFWGYKTGGIFQSDAEINSYAGTNGKPLQSGAKPGDVKFLNLNGDTLIDDNDKTMIGKPNPDYIFGFNVGITYKAFDFSMNIIGQTGNQIIQSYRDPSRYYYNYTTDNLNRWTGPGTSNHLPRVTLGDEANMNWRRFSDLYVHDGDFIKIKAITIGYDLKKSLLKKLPSIQQLRFFVSGTNLITFTKYKGMDPEVGYGSYYDSTGSLQDAYASGVDLGSYPCARTFLFGVNVKF